jgi:hypothetical protein
MNWRCFPRKVMLRSCSFRSLTLKLRSISSSSKTHFWMCEYQVDDVALFKIHSRPVGILASTCCFFWLWREASWPFAWAVRRAKIHLSCVLQLQRRRVALVHGELGGPPKAARLQEPQHRWVTATKASAFESPYALQWCFSGCLRALTNVHRPIVAFCNAVCGSGSSIEPI